MLRKDIRSLTLALILGDGCLYYVKRKVRRWMTGSNQSTRTENPECGKEILYGYIAIDHCTKQRDYQEWKAQLLSEMFRKDVRLRSGHNGRSIQISLSDKRLRSWRKFTYPNGEKDLRKILPFIRHKVLATAIWYCDDGYAERNGNGRLCGLRLFTCDQSLETQKVIKQWFYDEYGIKQVVKYQKSKQQEKSYPYLKLNKEHSLMLWKQIREFVLMFNSMKIKFKIIEDCYQKDCLQRAPSKDDDIVQPNGNVAKAEGSICRRD